MAQEASLAAEASNNLLTVVIDPFDRAFLANPYAHHDVLRDTGPVIWFEALGCYGMARHAEVQAALKDWQTFISGCGAGLADFAHEQPWRSPSLLLEADPPLLDRTRGLMNKIASLASLKSVRDAWHAKVDALVDMLVERRQFDAVTDLAEVFPQLVFPDLIGLREDGRENLLVYASAVFNAFGPRNDVFEEGNVVAGPATAWVGEVCKRENLQAGSWGMQVYEAADSGDCTQEEAERLVRSFLSAGVDTTVNGIGNMLHAFARNPDQWLALRADPSLAKRAFEESLRWDSTVQTFSRTTSRDVEIAGANIPEGSKVLLFLAAANRDPRKWDAPERFDIGRNASGHVGFEFGIHQCLGQMFARIGAEAVLAAMIPRIAAIRATGDPVRRLKDTLHALASMPVEIEPS